MVSLAQMDLAEKKPEQARKRFETVLAADPKNVRALLAIAGLREEAMGSARLGYTGKASIHPDQLPAIHAAFSPDDNAVARAQKIIAAFKKDTTGLVVVDGELIELPVVRSMYRVLAIAERIDMNRQPR